MKELSIEEKARAYDKVLKAAIAAHKDDDRHLKATLERIFPELKENEDERIRKEIIDTFKNLGDGKMPVDINYADIFTWLEKQGEPVEINPTEFDTRLQSLIGKFDSLPKEELIGSLSFWLNVVQNDGTYKADEKQGEQKPAKWSEWDELQYEAAHNLCENSGHTITSDWLETIKDRIQSRQEWTEEDENTIKVLMNIIRKSEIIDSIIYTDSLKEKLYDWLKSIGNRITWKPSKGQLECLGYAIDKARRDYSPLANSRIYLTLKALKEQLEKLTE